MLGECEVRLFAHGDDHQLMLKTGVFGPSDQMDVGFFLPRLPLELKWRCECLEGEEHKRLAMGMERRGCLCVVAAVESMIEVHFAAQSVDGAAQEEAAGIVSGSSDDDEWCSLCGNRVSPVLPTRRAELLVAGRWERPSAMEHGQVR